MSAPPDGDDDEHADDETQQQHQEECAPVFGEHEAQTEHHDGDTQQQVQHVLTLEHHRRALEQPEFVLARQLAEGDHGSAEGDGTDGGAQEQLEAVAGRDGVALLDDREGVRLGHRRNGDEHRGQTDHAVHEGHQLGHLGHLDALGHDGANRTAHHQTEEHVADARCRIGRELEDQAGGGEHGDGHARHAEAIADARRGGMGQALERLDEADGGDQVQQGDYVHAHREFSALVAGQEAWAGMFTCRLRLRAVPSS